MPILAWPYFRHDASTRASAASWASDQRPAQPGVMRPIGSTTVISTTTRPAPEIASAGRCCMCQSLATPLSELYWQSGGTTTRLARVTLRNVIGVKSWLVIAREFIARSRSEQLRERDAPPAIWRNRGAGGANPRVLPAKGVERASGITAWFHYDAKPRAIQVKLI